MTDEEVIQALEQHRLQRAAGQMQGMVAQAMFGIQSAAPEPQRPKMMDVLEQVAESERRASMNFQDPNDEQAQTVLSVLLDL